MLLIRSLIEIIKPVLTVTSFTLFTVAQRIEDNGSTLIKVVEEMFGSGVIADAITYRKASILKYVEAMTFFQRYARCLLRTVYIKETNMVDESVNENESISNFEVEWLAKMKTISSVLY